jgi:general secretion pathway protein J
MRASSEHSGQRGMTLLEIMIAIAILTFMMALAWGTIATTVRVKKSFEELEGRAHEIRVAMSRAALDLGAAYLSANEDQSAPERRTRFLGKRGSAVDELAFSTLGHFTMWANANESEQSLVTYFSAPDRDDSSKTDWLRRESRRLVNDPNDQEKSEVDVVLRDIEKVSFEYWDWKEAEWKADWNARGADAQRNRLPTRVRITVEVKDGNDTLKFSTQARLMLQEELNFFTSN